MEFPGSPVVRTLHFHCHRWGFKPWLGNQDPANHATATMKKKSFWSLWMHGFHFLTLIVGFSSVQSLSCVRFFVTPWNAACQASLSVTNSWSAPKPMSIELVMPSNHLIPSRPLLLPWIFPSITVFSNESALHIRWPNYWSFSFRISPSSEHPGLISFRMDLLQSKGLSRVFSNATVQKHQFFCSQLSL